jgi:hypothetical protein
MRILSIDLPWGGAGRTTKHYGFAAVDSDLADGTLDVLVRPADGQKESEMWTWLRDQWGTFDLVLMDHPLGGAHRDHPHYRPVERAFGNSTWCTSEGHRIQCPRFQGGAPHGEAGLVRARQCASQMQPSGGICVESFPQLSVPALLAYAQKCQIRSQAIQSLASHKLGPVEERRTAQGQLVELLEKWTKRKVAGLEGVNRGRGDAVDALLALLPALEWAAPEPSHEDTWGTPVWLNNFDPGALQLPSQVAKGIRIGQRAQWASPLRRREVGDPGIRTDGILSLNLPGWAQAGGGERGL